MYMNIYIFVVVLIIAVNAESILKQVHILYRHGDRAPSSIYPKSQNMGNKWPRGLGQLTVEGVRQQFQLGLWLRDRYGSFIGPSLNNSEIYVRSTDIDRTLMSAESNLAGFVFNEPHHIIQGLPWSPVPIHTVRGSRDYLLEFSICPLYTSKREALYNSPYFKNKLAPYQHLIPYLQQQTGITDLTFLTMWKVFDQLFCEKTHNITVDGWVTEKIWDQLLAINMINWELMFYEDLAKLTGGLLLYTITDHMKQASTNNGSWNKAGSKLMMYSGHDTDVAPLAKLLGFYHNQPPYASTIIVELYQNQPSIANKDHNDTVRWTVKVLYKNVTERDDFYVQQVSGCDSTMCDLSRFIAVTKDKRMSRDQFMSECGLSRSILIYVEIGFVLVCLGLFLFIVAMLCVRRYGQRRKRGPRYGRFDDDKDIN